MSVIYTYFHVNDHLSIMLCVLWLPYQNVQIHAYTYTAKVESLMARKVVGCAAVCSDGYLRTTRGELPSLREWRHASSSFPRLQESDAEVSRCLDGKRSFQMVLPLCRCRTDGMECAWDQITAIVCLLDMVVVAAHTCSSS